MDINPEFLPVIKGKTFKNQLVVLDGTRYEDCNFADCTIRYSGGPSDLSVCIFTPNTKWEILDQAAQVLQVLEKVGFRLEYGTPGPRAAVQMFQRPQ